ncbi:6-hydroxymethylpterin diphosphokinase MptE-like protein [Peptostreptococcaceae bacterium AGR-M142]
MYENFFEKNIELLKGIQPDLVNKLVECKETQKYNIYINRNDESVIEIKGSKDRLISKYNPKRDAKKAIEGMDFEVNSGLYIVMGLEWGYKLKEVFKKNWDKMRIIVVEKDLELLKLNLKKQDFSEMLKTKRIFFSAGEFEDEFYLEDLQNNLYNNLHYTSKVFITDITSTVDEDIEFFKKNIEFIGKSKVKYSFVLGNCPDDTLLGLRNRLNNIVDFIDKPGVNELLEKYGDVYKNKPAVVVASGPSLEKNIKYLKEYQDKILILACDGSYKRLKMEGIKAHAIGTIERIIKTYEAFYKGEEENFDEDLIMLSPAVVRTEIIDIFKDRFISFYKKDMHGNIFDSMDDKGSFFCGASVAHLLFGFAQKMGCNPIVLIGQDLAYSKDGASHANGVSVIEYKEDGYDCYVKDYYGNSLGSTSVWVQFKELYEEAIRKFDCKVIDATEGGAYIKGTEVKPLKEVLELYCKEDIEPLHNLFVDLNYKNKKSIEIKRTLVSYILDKYKLLLDMNDKIKICIKNLKKSLNILDENFTEEQLDWIYDIVFSVDDEILRPIMNDPYIHLVCAFLISGAANRISQLKAKEYNQEILTKNIEIQKILLETLVKYIRKTLRVTYLGLKEITKKVNLKELEMDEINFDKMEKEIEFILNNEKYYLPKI